MPEKKVSTPAADAPAAEGKTRKSTKAPARRGRPPLAPELYVEMGGEQYNITDIIDRAKADTAPPTRSAYSPARCTSSPRKAQPTTSSISSPASWNCNFSQGHRQHRTAAAPAIPA